MQDGQTIAYNAAQGLWRNTTVYGVQGAQGIQGPTGFTNIPDLGILGNSYNFTISDSFFMNPIIISQDGNFALLRSLTVKVFSTNAG